MRYARVARRRNASGLARGIEIVELLATAYSGGGMGLSQLPAASGGDKGVISRALATPLEVGMVKRDAATPQYRIGPRVIALVKLLWLAICDIEDKRARAKERGLGKGAKRKAEGRLGYRHTCW